MEVLVQEILSKRKIKQINSGQFLMFLRL
jgi:hypothetical protein